MGLQVMRVLYSESSAAEIQVARGYLNLGAELDHVTHMVLFLKKNYARLRGSWVFLCSFREWWRPGNVYPKSEYFKGMPRGPLHKVVIVKFGLQRSQYV